MNGFDFTRHRVCIIGASQGGIGAAMAHEFASAGAEVVITGIEDAPLPAEQAAFAYQQLDVTDAHAIDGFAAGLAGLDVLINCAAITARGAEMDDAFFAKVLDVNLQGSLRTARAFHHHLRNRQGSVINVASMYAQFGSPQNPAYGASKAGVQQLTKSLAIAWAGDGIRVNAIAPGFVVTAQSAKSREDSLHVENVTKRTPLGRWANPADIAGAALFLASPMAGFITGTCIPIDGGYSIA